MRRLVAFVAVLGLALVGVVSTPDRAAARAPDVKIGGFGIEYAPAGKDGAVVLPWMGCQGVGSNDATVQTMRTIRRSWMFGMSYVSVPPGTYRVSIESTCDGASDTFVGTRTVRRETDANTVTKAEFKRVKKGMRLSKVKKVVGNAGLGSGPVRLLDHRGSFGWAELSVKKGKVAGKWWHFPRGDGYVR